MNFVRQWSRLSLDRLLRGQKVTDLTLELIVFGRPLVKRFALCYRTVVCLSCLSCPVCNVGVLWPNGWTDPDETWHAGRPRPGHIVLDGDTGPLPQRDTAPNFRPIYVVAKWVNGSRCHLVGR